MFVVVNGVPSVGVMVMCGSGKIETQTASAVADLPVSSTASNSSSSNGSGSDNKDSGAVPFRTTSTTSSIYALVAPVLLMGLLLVR